MIRSGKLLCAGFALGACSTQSTPQIWSTICPPSFQAILNPNGTFIEAGDGRGRWRIESGALHVEVLQHSSVEFISLYPELISLDEDGVLPFVDERTVEAERDGLTMRFLRCS